MSDLSGLMTALARKYGNPPDWLAREVEEYVEAELDTSTPEARRAIYQAISRAHRMADGYPDPAAIRSAAWQWAKDGRPALARKGGDWKAEDHAPPEVDEELVKIDWAATFAEAQRRAALTRRDR